MIILIVFNLSPTHLPSVIGPFLKKPQLLDPQTSSSFQSLLPNAFRVHSSQLHTASATLGVCSPIPTS
ncbi:hypothetical protein DTO013E5_4937 [Penicillium roqueforti]|nr:hypothetical protein DTO012A1_3476 [Penicillium roqueforti]KAI2755421.1 hypothetical protein DTO013F2_1104 [Penicillium roqueforti]KAI2770701.1 hypothetical protein DTO012A8_4444 [Penicillium roqueforti]KAI3076981.1 hypothetical protein CBS147339_4951 [Penicillium roqueforti]KAI3103530.1 hypothetical protein CBS147338_2059 [Penicillium roqueforti]